MCTVQAIIPVESRPNIFTIVYVIIFDGKEKIPISFGNFPYRFGFFFESNVTVSFFKCARFHSVPFVDNYLPQKLYEMSAPCTHSTVLRISTGNIYRKHIFQNHFQLTSCVDEYAFQRGHVAMLFQMLLARLKL